MRFGIKAVSLFVAAALLSVILAPTFAAAREVNHALASNPVAVMAELESINASDVSDEVAAEVRGEGIWSVFVWLYKTSTPFRLAITSYKAYSLFGWELGRAISIAEGNPDPGPQPDPALLSRIIYWATGKIF